MISSLHQRLLLQSRELWKTLPHNSLLQVTSLALRFLFFFFQAEDGIRDLIVTGVQTCALPIWNTNQLEVIVKDGTPPNGTTYVDYTVSATVTGSPASSFDATAVGFVTDGTRRIDLNATFSATNLATDNPDVHAVVHWALDNPALTIDLDEKLDTPNANEATITVDFTYTYAGETVHLTGTVSVMQSPVSVTADVAVYENGGTEPVAVIRGTADAVHNGITITHRDGTQLSPAELAALDQLFQLPDRLEEALEQLFHPAEHFMGI